MLAMVILRDTAKYIKSCNPHPPPNKRRRKGNNNQWYCVVVIKKKKKKREVGKVAEARLGAALFNPGCTLVSPVELLNRTDA